MPTTNGFHRSLARYRRAFAQARALRSWRANLGAATLAALLPTTAPAQFPAVFELSGLDGTNGFVIAGVDPGDQSGRSVADAGDVNGDGIDDLIIGAPFANPNDVVDAGRSYVVFGRGGSPFPPTLELASLDGANGFELVGANEGFVSGISVNGAGDINGDGVDEVIVGSYRLFGPAQGISYLVYGRSTGDAFPASIDLDGLDGTDGFALTDATEIDRSGASVSGAGDINGDGVDDLLLGAPDAISNRVSPRRQLRGGVSRVVFGRDASVGAPAFPALFDLAAFDATDGLVINGDEAQGGSGRSVSHAGDVNGDGIDDVIIGAPDSNPDGVRRAGKSHVVFGRDASGGGGFDASLELTALDGENGFTINGVDDDGQSGRVVDGVGDVNGDGIDDIIIGDRRRTNSGAAAKSYIVFGRDTTGSGVGFPASIDVNDLDGTNGFSISGFGAPRLAPDRWVSGAGDVNGDGVDDLIIGSPYGSDEAGESFVVFGRDASLGESFAPSFDLGDLNGTNGFTLRGVTAGDQSGFAVSGAGDVNGDGIDDLAIGSYRADPNGTTDAGETYVIFGRRVPEPAAALLAAPGLLAWLTRRRR